jgi:hypothetical protein
VKKEHAVEFKAKFTCGLEGCKKLAVAPRKCKSCLVIYCRDHLNSKKNKEIMPTCCGPKIKTMELDGKEQKEYDAQKFFCF